MEGIRTSRRQRLRWVDYKQRGLVGLQKRVMDDRVQKGVEYDNETGTVSEGEKYKSRTSIDASLTSNFRDKT